MRDMLAYFESDEYKAKVAKEKAEDEFCRAKAACELDDDKLRRARSYGIPERAAMVVLSTGIEETEAIRAAVGTKDMLVLSGAPGCGKTVAAALWATEEIRKPELWAYTDHLGNVYGSTGNQFKGSAIVWVTAAKLARWERYDQEEMAKLLRVGKLVIDDLGGEYLDKGGFYASLLDELINERQAGSRATILTTNLDAAGFSLRYGERIVDRIREGGRFFACGNASLRRKPIT